MKHLQFLEPKCFYEYLCPFSAIWEVVPQSHIINYVVTDREKENVTIFSFFILQNKYEHEQQQNFAADYLFTYVRIMSVENFK